MKIKKGDILIGTNPYSGETKKYKYMGRDNTFKGWGMKLIEGGTRAKLIVSDSWIKEFNLKLFRRKEDV